MWWWVFWIAVIIIATGGGGRHHAPDVRAPVALHSSLDADDISDYDQCVRQRPWYRKSTCDGEQTIPPSQLEDRR